ncbi:MAG: hypothetical protein NC932_03460 [Candidatus Omnitrophica bacterium]|nr:hypothetical protein [Candidatus Omnitrophota bacterium]
MKLTHSFLVNFIQHPGRLVHYLIRNIEIRKNTKKILRYQGGLYKVNKDIRPVYFLGRYSSVAFKLGGLYIIEALRKAGIKAFSGYYASSGEIRNSIIVIIKKLYGKFNILKLKENGNIVVFDIRDNYDILNGTNNLIDISDYLIFPNQVFLNEILRIKNKLPESTVLYGYADPAISTVFSVDRYEKFEEITSCYFGYRVNVDLEILEILQKEIPVTIISSKLKNIDKLVNFNMHIDIRKKKEEDLYKPLTKILIAAECSSNIILEKTPRVLEILPDDYPFFISRNNIEDEVKRIKSLFNTEKWDYGLSVMATIREKYTFRNHIQSFIKILEELS